MPEPSEKSLENSLRPSLSDVDPGDDNDFDAAPGPAVANNDASEGYGG